MRQVPVVACLLGALCAPAAAQIRPAPVAHVSFGWAGFVDDATKHHTVVGGAALWHLTPRLSLGPEIVHMRGPDHDRDLFVTGKVVFDITRNPRSGRPPAVTPYIVVDGGFSRHSDRLAGGTFASHEGAFSGGGGVRVWLSDRVFAAPEIRLGWELHTRATVALGLRLGDY